MSKPLQVKQDEILMTRFAIAKKLLLPSGRHALARIHVYMH